MTSRRPPARTFLRIAAAGAAAYVIWRLLRRRQPGLQLYRSITVGAPAEAVYDFWSRFDNFPSSFSFVKDIRRTGNDNEWRWTIAGADGQNIEWDAWITESIPGKAIAWESAPGSPLRSAGVVQFTDSGKNSTRVDLRMSYRPTGRRSARALAEAFGPDPKASLDESLARLQAKFDQDVLTPEDSV
jgi:uncharacterized membrane protein